MRIALILIIHPNKQIIYKEDEPLLKKHKTEVRKESIIANINIVTTCQTDNIV